MTSWLGIERRKAVLAHPVVEYLRSHKGPKIFFGKDRVRADEYMILA